MDVMMHSPSIHSPQVPYAITDGDTVVLLQAANATAEERQQILARYLAERGTDALLDLFGQFMALASSVTDNCRTQVELLLVTEGGLHPHEAEKVNLPTIAGALRGVHLANGIDPTGTCASCALRLGTPANQSPSTTQDIEHCSDDFKMFFCHKRGVTSRGELTRRCVGDAKRQRSQT